MKRLRVAFCILMAVLVLIVPCAAATTFPFLTPTDDTAGTETEDAVSVSGDETGSSVLVPGSNNYAYLKVHSVSYSLKNLEADITVVYTIEPWLSVLVFLFGKQDLKNRIQGLIQYPESGYNQTVTFQYIGTDKAVLHVTNVAVDNQDNSYWLKPHSFSCTIPLLTFVISDTDVKTFTNVKDMAKGLGYFRT